MNAILLLNPAKTKFTRKIDLIVHSMGFTYSLSMTSYLNDKFEPDANRHKICKYWIHVPENACSATGFDVTKFDEVWQYGTVEPIAGNPRPHKLVENDGVAPQCGVPGLNWDDDKYGRVRFGGDPAHLNFVDAHLGEHYGWVINRAGRGEVKKR